MQRVISSYLGSPGALVCRSGTLALMPESRRFGNQQMAIGRHASHILWPGADLEVVVGNDRGLWQSP